MKVNYFIAFDLGATSGRTILGKLEGEKLALEEITRFPNQMLQWNGHFYWNIYSLYENLKKGFVEVARKGVPVTSAGIDTWGVDIVCVNSDGELCGIPYAYRDPQTIGKKEEYFDKVMNSRDVYMRSGIQHMDFNTIFQLYVMNERKCNSMQNADKILFIPDALNYMLTGKEVTEYTIASTSGLLNPESRDWDDELLKSVGVDREKWAPIVKPAAVANRFHLVAIHNAYQRMQCFYAEKVTVVLYCFELCNFIHKQVCLMFANIQFFLVMVDVMP